MGEEDFLKELNSLMKFEVNTIRENQKLKAFQRKRAVAELVIRDLEARGQLIRTQDDDLYFFERERKTLFPLTGEDFRSPLYFRFGLNATEDETRFVERDIVTRAMTTGKRAEVQRLSFWNRSTKQLYVSLNDGTMMRLNGDTISTVDNGDDGVLFLADRRSVPIKPIFEGEEPFNRVFAGLSLAGDAIHQSQMLALLKVWILAVFFFHALPVRPIVALVGEQGSGKTTLGRRFGLVLAGVGFDVASFRSDAAGEQDFLAAITSRRFAVFDNADSRIAWLPDHLAKLATGSEIQRRKLYTTNDCVSYKPDCFLMLTSRDPRWKRDDVAKRLLPIRMDTIEKTKIPERRLQQAILDQRPEIWGAMLTTMNTIVRALRTDDNSFVSDHRLADFHWFGRLAADALNLSDDFTGAMESLNATQFDLLAEGDEKLELFQAWTDAHPKEWNASFTAKEVFTALRALHDGQDRDFPFKNGTSVGTWLGRYRELIGHKLDVQVTHDRSSMTRAWRFLKTRCHDDKAKKDIEIQRLKSNDTMTPSFDSKVSSLEEVNLDVT